MNAVIRGHRCPKCSLGEVFYVSGEDGYECPIASADSDMKMALQVWNAWKFDALSLQDVSGWMVEAVMQIEGIVREYQAEEVKRGTS